MIEHDERLCDAERNPLGIVRAEVRAWKRDEGVWHPVAGEAWWDEYAPLREERAPNEHGKLAPTGKHLLESSWIRMGRVMIAKCAEAQALRRGWPDVLSGLYSEEELHAAKLAEQTASERLRRKQEEADALRRVSRDALWLIFEPEAGLESVPRGDAAARIAAFYRDAKTSDKIEAFQTRNQDSLRILWDWAPDEALRLKLLADNRRATEASPPRPRRRPRSRPEAGAREQQKRSRRPS